MMVLPKQIVHMWKIRNIQDIPGGKVDILGGHNIGHSKEKSLYEHVSYSERFPIFGAQYFKFDTQCSPSLPP
jgi:hypothetical protein